VPDNLPREQLSSLRKLVKQYADIFSRGPHDIGHTTLAEHSIDTGDATPIRQAPRRIPHHMLPQVNDEIRNMQNMGSIRPSKSPWSSPIVIVIKRDKTMRLCIDYRKLNDVTKKHAFPLPRIEDMLDSLRGSTVFTTLDLISAYHAVPVEKDSIEKTAFCVPWGLYEYTVMPFGLCNAPATFQSLMTSVMAGLLGTQVLCYVDDLVVFGVTFEQHLSRLQAVFSRLRDAGLKIKIQKCKFASPSVTFLGYVVSAAGIAVDPEKVSRVESWPTPKCVKDVQTFLGFANYYRKYIPQFADVTVALVKLTEKDTPFNWTDAC
jgi:hypothetical protein